MTEREGRWRNIDREGYREGYREVNGTETDRQRDTQSGSQTVKQTFRESAPSFIYQFNTVHLVYLSAQIESGIYITPLSLCVFPYTY